VVIRGTFYPNGHFLVLSQKRINFSKIEIQCFHDLDSDLEKIETQTTGSDNIIIRRINGFWQDKSKTLSTNIDSLLTSRFGLK
jgi:hypothetical protein